MNARIFASLCILLAAVAVVGCSQSSSDTVVVPPDTTGAPTGQDTGSTGSSTGTDSGAPTGGDSGAAAEQSFAVDVDEFTFSPNSITVKEGAKVTLTLTNSGEATHGFAMPDFGVSQRIAPGETKTVTFTADKQGSFRFFCNVPCGSGHMNMKGTVIVE